MKITVTKLQAVRRQLETALTLYFDGKDPVSIHTLASAAYNVIRDVNRNKGGKPMLVKELHADQFVEKLGQTPKHIADILNETENFFKHAGRDADKTLTFDDGQAELLLLDACEKYREITNEMVPMFGAFILWMVSQKPHIIRPKLLPPELAASQREFGEALRKSNMTRRQWLDYALAALGQNGTA
jgi:hypothetical protein